MIQERNLASAYIVKPIDPTCKAVIPQVRCPEKAWNLLRTMFQAVLVVSMDAKLSSLLSIRLNKSEKVVRYSNRILDFANELLSAGYQLSEVEQKRALLSWLTFEIDVNAETANEAKHSYYEAVLKLIVRETLSRTRRKRERRPFWRAEIIRMRNVIPAE